MVMTAQEVADAALALDRLRRRAWNDREKKEISGQIDELLNFGVQNAFTAEGRGARVDLRNARGQENPRQG